MQRAFLLILPIWIIVGVALTVFGVVQVHFEEEKLMDDLHRKLKHLAESMELSVGEALKNKDIRNANYLVEKFENRERLQGCAIFNAEGNVFAITQRFSDWTEQDSSQLRISLSEMIPQSKLENFRENTVYSFLLPVMDEDKNILGVVKIIHDTSYISSRVKNLWKRLSFTLVFLVISIFIILFFIQRQLFSLPVRRITQWFHGFQRGDTDSFINISTQGELGKLAKEVEQVALKLKVARRTISEKAFTHLKSEEHWTEEKLRNLIHAKLGENVLCVVSNREPFMHINEAGTSEIKCVKPAGGVVSALHPVLSACGGTWIAHGSGNADKKTVNSMDKLGVPPLDIRYILKRVWLSKEEEEGYYYGFSNEGLWPLCHYTHTRPVFREKDWHAYKKVNRKFADAIIDELPAKNPFVFIQDYHFTLLGKYIKEKRPDAYIALFWHIPWPNSESFAICPYHKEILEGLLGCDLLGFHIQNYCNNFLDTANRLLESRIDTEKHSVMRLGKETLIRPFPISVETAETEDRQQKEITAITIKIRKEFDLENKIIAVGVDRVDYTKGIIERLLAIDRLLEKHPEYQNRFVFIQLGAPSRTHIKRYREFNSEVDDLVDKINWRYQENNWKPVIYLKKHFSPDEILPFYSIADICIVSSLHDGMNLVAKEYVWSKKDLSGTLILSQFAGAAKEMTDSVLINPYSTEEFADAIKAAIDMPEEEKKRRMHNLRAIVAENNVYRWAANIISELTSLNKNG